MPRPRKKKDVSPVADEGPRSAGRPRCEAARTAVLDAGYKLLSKASVQAISVQEIAAEAGVSTATLYRWWPTKEAVLLDSYTNRVDDTALLHADGSPLHRLRKHLMNVAQMFKGEEGRVSLRLLMAIQEDQILRGAFFERIYRPKVDRCLAVMREAVEQGELPRGTDLRLFLDSVFGVLLTNLILKHEDVDNALIGKAFDFAVAGAQAKAR